MRKYCVVYQSIRRTDWSGKEPESRPRYRAQVHFFCTLSATWTIFYCDFKALRNIPASITFMHPASRRSRAQWTRRDASPSAAPGLRVQGLRPAVRAGFGRMVCRSGGYFLSAQAVVMPLCRSSASTLGSRPRKALKDSSAGRLPPTARTSSRKRPPLLLSSTPFSSNRL